MGSAIRGRLKDPAPIADLEGSGRQVTDVGSVSVSRSVYVTRLMRFTVN